MGPPLPKEPPPDSGNIILNSTAPNMIPLPDDCPPFNTSGQMNQGNKKLELSYSSSGSSAPSSAASTPTRDEVYDRDVCKTLNPVGLEFEQQIRPPGIDFKQKILPPGADIEQQILPPGVDIEQF